MKILFVADLHSREDRYLAIFTARAFSSEAASVSASSCSSSRLYRISGRRGLTRHHAELFTLTPARGGARWPELSGRGSHGEASRGSSVCPFYALINPQAGTVEVLGGAHAGSPAACT
jgi:hypothetical protein